MVEVDVAGTEADRRKFGDASEVQRDCRAECHRADDEHGVEGARDARSDEVVEHVVRRIDQRHAGHDEEGAGDDGVHGGRGVDDALRERSQGCRDEGGDGDACIIVEAALVAEDACIEAEKGADRRDEEGDEVAAEEQAGAAAGEAGADGGREVRVGVLAIFESLQFLFEAFERPVVAHGAPDDAAYGGEDGHAHAVLAAFREFRVGALLVLDVEEKRRIHDVTADVFGRDAHVSRRAHDVARRSVGVGAVLHEESADHQDEVHFIGDLVKWIFEYLIKG